MRAAAVSERKNALSTMAELADQRVQQINSFIGDAKKTLTVYADAPEIKKALEEPENEKAAAEAQEFTEQYSEHIDDLEGIYASDLTTLVRIHNDRRIVGMITRPNPDTVKELMQSMQDAEDGIYDTGIIRSPASGVQIVSLYKLISGDGDNNVGFAGFGVKADSLFNNDIPSLKGVKSAYYSMISVDHHKYLFKGDSETGGEDVTNDSILSLCNELSGTDAPAKGNIAYQDENGSYIAAYSFMPEYGMLVMAEGKTK